MKGFFIRVSIKGISVLIFLLLQIVFSDNISYAQSRSFGGLPILRPKTQITYSDHLNHLPEYQYILDIYEQLVQAKGDRRMQVPALYLRKEEAYVASVDYRLLDISIEKTAFDVAKKYGDAGVAFLLAHELTHYYEKHGWRSHYSDEISDLESGRLLRIINDGVSNEVQADVLGGFLAYSAGFGIFENGGKLIEELYRVYKMKDRIPGYPSKKDRIALSDRNKIQITQMANQFEMANLLTIVGKYSEAYAYYGYILNKYQSRELYNNAGLTCMLSACSMIDPKVLVFDLPGFMDLEFSGSSRSASQIAEVLKLLDEAQIHFETAILMNRDYLPAHINKASVSILKHIVETDLNQKNGALSKAKYTVEIEIKNLINRLETQYFDADVLILQSLLEYYSDNRQKSLSLMAEAAGAGNETARKNLAVMNGSAQSPMARTEKIDVYIDNMNADTFLKAGMVSRNMTNINDANVFRVTDQSHSNYKILMHEFKGNEQEFGFDLAFMVSKDSFKEPFYKDIGIGSHKNDLMKDFGQPKRSLSYLKGEIILFNNDVIIFTDHNSTIVKMVDFVEHLHF